MQRMRITYIRHKDSYLYLLV